MQSVLARSDSLSQSTVRNQTNFDESIYHDYMIIHVKGEKKAGIIHKIELIKDGVSTPIKAGMTWGSSKKAGQT